MIAKIEIEAALALLKECRFSGFSNLESKNSLRVNAAKRHLEKVLEHDASDCKAVTDV